MPADMGGKSPLRDGSNKESIRAEIKQISSLLQFKTCAPALAAKSVLSAVFLMTESRDGQLYCKLPARYQCVKRVLLSKGFLPMSLRPFHSAFPVHDLDAARTFYAELLGCSEGCAPSDL
jgi:hypothetical protein